LKIDKKKKKLMNQQYIGSCFCGSVKFELSGAPKAMGYCHCSDCATWSAAPISGFSLWNPDSVKILKGSENIASFNKSEKSHRKFCRICGGHLMMEHPKINLIDIYPNAVPIFPHVPSMHVHYQEKSLAVLDGLPKYNDLPEMFGGTGKILQE